MIGVIVFFNFLLPVFGNLTAVDLNKCKITHAGTEYLGKEWKTETNITCQYWRSAKQKGSELIINERFPDGSIVLAKNYCRNPNNNPKGPWCYSTHKKLIYDTCKVPLCQTSDCRVSGPGMEYSGFIDKSVTGKKCTKWKSKQKTCEKPWRAVFNDRFFPDGSVSQAGRYCRNPDSSTSGPWCFVESDNDLRTKELCDIPFCDDIANLMYAEGSHTGEYFFFSSINESHSLNVSFRIWNPASWFDGELFLFLTAYDIATDRDEIERWNSGIEIKFSHNGTRILVTGEDTVTESPQILSGAKWTDLEIKWANKDNQSLIVQVFQKPKMKPIAMSELFVQNSIFEVQSFRFVSFGGTPAFWNIPSNKDECPVHTVTKVNSTRYWLIKNEFLNKKIDVFLRANKEAEITLRVAPMISTNQVQITFFKRDKIGVFTNDIKNQRDEISSCFWPNALSFWKWEYFKIRIFKGKLQVYWVLETVTNLLLETTHKNLESVMWVSFGSSKVSYWTIYCDPRGISDPPAPAPPECVTRETEPFNGTLSVTKSGKQCIPWTDKTVIPEKYNNDDLFKAYGGRANCENFCRNFNCDPNGAYCIVRNPKTELGYVLEHCHPRSCSLSDCKLAGTGNDYIGQLNITRSRRECKAWTEVLDKMVNINNFPDPNLKDAGNYCRNPSKSIAGTWCYTTDRKVLRDVCYVKDCDKPLECTILTSTLREGTYTYILPRWRKHGLQFWLKAWNPDLYEGLIISLYSLDLSLQYLLILGDEENEKLKFFYRKRDEPEKLLVQKTLPHLVPTGKWKGYWLRTSRGMVELGYQGVQIPFFEWTSSQNEMSFEPMFINFGTIQNHWMGINFLCDECLTTQTTSRDGYKIYPINLWHQDGPVYKLRLNLRGQGSAFVTLMWTPDFEMELALQFFSNTSKIYIVKFLGRERKVLGSYAGSHPMADYEWSEYMLHFTERNINVYRGGVELVDWKSPFPLLIYWFSVTAEGGVIIWSANCPAADIDGKPRDGNWGRWGSWSCSVTCGKGEGRIERKCDDPPPNVFGKECKGSPVYEGSCNDFPCGKISPDTTNIIRHHLSSRHKSIQVDVAERVVLPCNSKAISLITSEVYEINITWTHNGFPYSRTRFHMDENYSLVIPRAQEKYNGIYLCMAYQDPDSIPSKVVLEVISLVVIKSKPTKKIRIGNSLTLKCNGLALSYVYADLSQRWELNGTVWKDYGLGTLQAFTVDKLENITDSHAGIWTCVILQEDFQFKWTTNWLYLKVKSAPSFWSHLMEDVATAPLFGKLGNERNAMILFFALIGGAVFVVILIIVVLVKWLQK